MNASLKLGLAAGVILCGLPTLTVAKDKAADHSWINGGRART